MKLYKLHIQCGLKQSTTTQQIDIEFNFIITTKQLMHSTKEEENLNKNHCANPPNKYHNCNNFYSMTSALVGNLLKKLTALDGSRFLNFGGRR